MKYLKNIRQSHLLIASIAGLVFIALFFVFVVNLTLRQTVRHLCSTNKTYETVSICPQAQEDVYDKFADQFGPRPAHLFLSDAAFREIFVPMGFNSGTMPDSIAYNPGLFDCKGMKAQDGTSINVGQCFDELYAAKDTAGVLRRNIFIMFCIWLIGTTLLLQYIIKTIYRLKHTAAAPTLIKRNKS